MANVDRMRGAVALPEAGEGVVLRFLSKDRSALRGVFGENWFDDAVTKLSVSFDEDILKTLLKHGAKTHAGEPIYPADVEVDLDDIDLPLADISARVVDAMCVGAFGRTYEQQFAHVTEQLKKAEGLKNPPAEGPTIS